MFDLDPKRLGTFDIVYSWGVLHHTGTGSLWEAADKAIAMVAPGGLLAIALYHRTRTARPAVHKLLFQSGVSRAIPGRYT